MRNHAVVAGRPAPPRAGQAVQVLTGRQALLDGPVPEGRLGQPLGPQRAPPGPVAGAGVAPAARRRLDRGEPGRPGPGQHAPARVRLAAERPRHPPVQLPPLGQFRILREPEHPAVVAVARRDQAAGAADPPHLGQRADRVGQVLQHLVGVYHVERAVTEGQAVHVTDLEGEVGLALAGGFPPGHGQHVPGPVDPDDLALGHPGGEARGDRARTAADVEDPRRGRQPREQVPGRVLGGPPLVRPEHAVVVAVQVHVRSAGHPLIIPRRHGGARGSHLPRALLRRLGSPAARASRARQPRAIVKQIDSPDTCQ